MSEQLKVRNFFYNNDNQQKNFLEKIKTFISIIIITI